MQIQVTESMPGLKAARYVQSKIKEIGIQDIELYFDNTIKPQGMWAICQLNKPTNTILLLRGSEATQTKPEIMWWCKTNDGHFRVPSDQDISDIIATVQRAHVAWDKGGDWLADRFDEQSREKDRKHREDQHKMIQSIAKPMKKAMKEGRL